MSGKIGAKQINACVTKETQLLNVSDSITNEITMQAWVCIFRSHRKYGLQKNTPSRVPPCTQTHN